MDSLDFACCVSIPFLVIIIVLRSSLVPAKEVDDHGQDDTQKECLVRPCQARGTIHGDLTRRLVLVLVELYNSSALCHVHISDVCKVWRITGYCLYSERSLGGRVYVLCVWSFKARHGYLREGPQARQT